MTVTGTQAVGPEPWLAARLAAGRPAEEWFPLPDWPHEASTQGLVRTISGLVLAQRFTSGYWRIDLYDPVTKKRRKGVPVHWCVLTACDKPRPEGMQASHLQGNPDWNWWPEALAWEDQPTNERRKTSRPAPPDPTHPCKNAPACPNLVLHPGRRCRPCVIANGREAAAMLNDGRRLDQVAAHFGLTARWVYEIAVEHGGYEGSPEQARGQRPELTGWRKRAARWLGAA